MKYKLSVISLLFLSAFYFGCKKSNGNPSNSDCETNNHGTIKVTFGDLTRVHILNVYPTANGILSGPVVRSKTSPKNTGFDTLYLTPGTYRVFFISTDDNGLPHINTDGAAETELCKVGEIKYLSKQIQLY